MNGSFWNRSFEKPFVVVSPMDGITDAAFRYIIDTYGKSSVLITEFTSVEGVARGAKQLMNAFIYHKTSTPTVAQIFGVSPEDYYTTTIALCYMGFDGIDINMGCPDSNVAKRGGGAGLIRTPKLAQEIIHATKRAVNDWRDGITMTEAKMPRAIDRFVHDFIQKQHIIPHRKLIPVSVKTRTGYDTIVAEDWMKYLVEAEPASIALHGRTLKQLYSGFANWEVIGKCAEYVRGQGIPFFGNGDIQTMEQAQEYIQTYQLNGVFVGRAVMGNPWFFTNQEPDVEKRCQVAMDHCTAFMDLIPQTNFLSLRKHLAWYCKGMSNAKEVRNALVQTSTIEEVREILKPYLL